MSVDHKAKQDSKQTITTHEGKEQNEPNAHDQTPPKILYHYTDQAGLIGILSSKTLWATKIQYLNDASEHTEPLSIAQSVLDRMTVQNAKKPKAVQIIDFMKQDLRSSTHVNICISSFCTDGDLLSQWRGYGLPRVAYSIGFDTRTLLTDISTKEFELKPCRYYDNAGYEDEIAQEIGTYLKQALKTGAIRDRFPDGFIKKAATMKRDCFREESEWRLVSSTAREFDEPNFNYRSTRSLISPYYAIPFNPVCIRKVIVGPCQYPKLAQDAVQGLGFKHKI
ncbi:MAG: DUF2971 domain-containing protein [Dehalococcoidia bacterium]|jgi:hypothetical protein